ncbi:hypothetical protein V2E38_12735, partial [Bifidobacterium longum subsp. infantis]|nr:hypothetical protein [Bifidobacterium longum subsp. infantis]
PPMPARRRAQTRGVEDDARAWGLKERIESLADLGDGEQARRLAHEAGACARATPSRSRTARTRPCSTGGS